MRNGKIRGGFQRVSEAVTEVQQISLSGIELVVKVSQLDIERSHDRFKHGRGIAFTHPIEYPAQRFNVIGAAYEMEFNNLTEPAIEILVTQRLEKRGV